MANNITILAAGTFIRGDLFNDDVLIVEGGVEGNVVGNRVIIKAKGWLHGQLSCRSLSIEPGGQVHGYLRVTLDSSTSLPAMEPIVLLEESTDSSEPLAESSEIAGNEAAAAPSDEQKLDQ